MAPINPPTDQANNSSPRPPPAPVLAPITNTPSKPMGRKSSSIFFHQPTTNTTTNSSPTNPNLQNDRNLFVSIEGSMFLDIRNPPPSPPAHPTSNKRHKDLHTPILEDVPAFFLPGPANRSLVDAHYIVDVKTRRRATHYAVGDMEALDLAGEKDDEIFKVVGSKKRGFESLEMRGCGEKEGNSVGVGAADAVPTMCMENLKIDDKRVDGNGGANADADVDVVMHNRDAEPSKLGKGKRRFSAVF